MDAIISIRHDEGGAGEATNSLHLSVSQGSIVGTGGQLKLDGRNSTVAKGQWSNWWVIYQKDLCGMPETMYFATKRQKIKWIKLQKEKQYENQLICWWIYNGPKSAERNLCRRAKNHPHAPEKNWKKREWWWVPLDPFGYR